MNDDVAVEARAHDVLADVALGVGLRQFGFEHALHVVELAADVDVRDLGADRPAADEAALEERVRVALHEDVILERPWLALVSVAADVLRQRRVLEDELPLEAGGKSCAAAAAQAGGLDEVDHLARLHRQRLAQPVVRLMLQRKLERMAVRLADVGGKNRVHFFCSRLHRSLSASALRLALPPAFGGQPAMLTLLDVQMTAGKGAVTLRLDPIDESGRILGLQLLVPVLVVDHHDWRTVAGAETLELHQREHP